MKNTTKILLCFVAVFVGIFAFTTTTNAKVMVVYDALPVIEPKTSYPGQPFQAQKTFEFGDSIHLVGSNPILDSITVTMVTWSRYSEYSNNKIYSKNNTNWTHPITLNVYSTQLDANGVPNELLATSTQDITVPWRKEGDRSCQDAGYGTGFAWRTYTFNCVNGLAFNIVFDMSNLKVTLPNDIIVSVAFNTGTYGVHPIKSSGPYDSLYVAVPISQSVNVGIDNSIDKEYLNSLNGTYPGIFHEYTDLTPNGTVALQVTADTSIIGPPTDKGQCKNDNWKIFNFPYFNSQTDCVIHVQNKKNTIRDKIFNLYITDIKQFFKLKIDGLLGYGTTGK